MSEDDDLPQFALDEPCDWSRGDRPRCGNRPTTYVGDIYHACADHYEAFAEWLELTGEPNADGDQHDERVCQTCGAGSSFLVPVWEERADAVADVEPDYLGCTECHTMARLKDDNR